MTFYQSSFSMLPSAGEEKPSLSLVSRMTKNGHIESARPTHCLSSGTRKAFHHRQRHGSSTARYQPTPMPAAQIVPSSASRQTASWSAAAGKRAFQESLFASRKIMLRNSSLSMN